MVTTQSQPIIFLITMYGGVALGAVFEVYRMLRKCALKRKWISFIYDSLFILFMGAIVTFVLYVANQGELRLYTIVGFILGFALYMSGISPLIAHIVNRIKGRKKCRKKNKAVDK